MKQKGQRPGSASVFFRILQESNGAAERYVLNDMQTETAAEIVCLFQNVFAEHDTRRMCVHTEDDIVAYLGGDTEEVLSRVVSGIHQAEEVDLQRIT